ncbi:heavy-metal-associated domain-containing protein [Salinibacterium sp. ZJ450]|uniref:heavy-metal-associated domain-containing protein n=1 Tax=Salinibacterium sp. ZJ450 TaxID=2708338 RepID=UPI001CD5839D|nr:heavy-metal-associated domain-containing protein [Salinibacterium sp. ZJ450]
MCGTNASNDLGLTDRNGGCACGHGHSPATTAAAAGNDLVTTNLPVTGMTCGHCVSSVTEELSSLDGVESVSVQLNVGGVSTVTVASTMPLDPAAIRAAVDVAGYALAQA